MDKSKKQWDEKELKEFKALIIQKRTKVLDELEEAKKRANEARNNNSVNAIYSSHMADASTDQQELEKNYYWMDREKKYIQYLNRALEMIEDEILSTDIEVVDYDSDDDLLWSCTITDDQESIISECIIVDTDDTYIKELQITPVEDMFGNAIITITIDDQITRLTDSQDVPIKPITLIFGANSAGKSSILQGLLYMREAADTGRFDFSHTKIMKLYHILI